jgi:hypothetical protein
MIRRRPILENQNIHTIFKELHKQLVERNQKGLFTIEKPISVSIMVGDEVSGWNPLLNSLLCLAEQLEELGVVYAKGKTVYVEPVKVRNI